MDEEDRITARVVVEPKNHGVHMAACRFSVHSPVCQVAGNVSGHMLGFGVDFVRMQMEVEQVKY